ncbi:MAG: ATP-binding protein, partial [Candidatus Methylumidiphilus sp.]
LAMPNALRAARIALSDSTSLMVLYEILGNAKKFHPSHMPAVECAVTALAGNRVCVSLSDDGLHLSPQQLSRAFMPYQQIEKHSTGAIPGMGLGLSRVAILVLQAGGQIHMRNREDKVGITVEMELPIA